MSTDDNGSAYLIEYRIWQRRGFHAGSPDLRIDARLLPWAQNIKQLTIVRRNRTCNTQRARARAMWRRSDIREWRSCYWSGLTCAQPRHGRCRESIMKVDTCIQDWAWAPSHAHNPKFARHVILLNEFFDQYQIGEEVTGGVESSSSWRVRLRPRDLFVELFRSQ